MQITKLTLENFSSYEGINIIDFSVDHDKPIILIGGQNGAGKTSIFTAIRIALYGPLAFGYAGINSYYQKKIKSFINDKAFQYESFSSGVSIELKITKERETQIYTITRHWNLENSKINEQYTVKEGGRELDESELVIFDNYILNIVPIDIFEFFLFDGEEVGNIFSTENYSRYIKTAMLTMCGIDDFEILQNFCKNHVGKSNSASEDDLGEQYSLIVKRIETLENDIKIAKAKIESLRSVSDELSVIIEEKNAVFIRSGGIPKEEAEKLEEEEKQLDKKREILAHEIKAFFEGLMPFIIMRDLIPKLNKQVRYEEKASIYEYVSNLISKQEIVEIMGESNSEELSNRLYDYVLKKLKPIENGTSKIILDLSKSEEAKLLSLAQSVTDYPFATMIKKIKKRNALVKRISDIRARLRNSLSDDDAQMYMQEIHETEHRLEMNSLEIQQLENTILLMRNELDTLITQKSSLYSQLLETTQSKHVFEYSEKIGCIMEKLISSSLYSIRSQLADKIIENLNQIYRKDNLISHLTITDNFKFNLYQMQNFTVSELRALLTNIGDKEFKYILGEESINVLCDFFDVSEDCLESAINFSSSDKVFMLNKRVELSMLSKGERQIFILALYWAIIQISGKHIPFIIDTPYARIDANHREEISSKFFPSISSQVVILSTDEEITKEYYSILKPYISREYLLSNNQSENRTTVADGYFFKEG